LLANTFYEIGMFGGFLKWKLRSGLVQSGNRLCGEAGEEHGESFKSAYPWELAKKKKNSL
jgi:hypothetical protein